MTWRPMPWPPVAEVERRVTERIQASLPSAEFAAQVASGQTQAPPAALAQALATLGASPPADTWLTRASSPKYGGTR